MKDDKINGRNEEQREAQLLQHAKTEFLAVKTLEKQLDLLKIDYRNAEREWETLMAISKLGD